MKADHFPNWSFQSRSPKAVSEGSSISLKFSPFVTINEISVSWNFQLHTYYQSIFVAIWNLWLFHKSSKIWVWANFRGQFLEIEFLETTSPNFPWSSPESVPGSAKIISWTFGIRKNISFEISKKYWNWVVSEPFQNLCPCNSRVGLF